MLVDNVADALEIIASLQSIEYLTVDTETTGLRPFHGDRICGIAISSDESFYFPFRHGEGYNLPLDILHNNLKKLLTDREKTYIGFNYKFDMQMLYMDGIPLPTKIAEVEAMAHLCNENERKGLTQKQIDAGVTSKPGFRLKYLASKYIKPDAEKESNELEEKIIAKGYAHSITDAKSNMWRLPASDVAPYACEDVNLTRALYDFYLPNLVEWKQYEIFQETCEYYLIITQLEMNGLLLNPDRIREYMEEANSNISTSYEKVCELAGYKINCNSPKQVTALLGTESSDKDTLIKLVNQNDPRKDLAEAILDYRGWSKVSNTYYLPYLAKLTGDNKLHPHMSLTGTVSRRFSCFEPNLQTIPRYNKVYKVKDCYVAEKGYKLVSFDYSQAELRLAAHYMEIFTEQYIVKLKELLTGNKAKWARKELERVDQPYEQTLSYLILNNIDLHQTAADSIKRDRHTGKQLNFMVQYNVGGVKLAQKLNIAEPEGFEILDKYHNRFPGYRILQKYTQDKAEKLGYIRVWTGNVCHFNDTQSCYKASSRLIQGGVAEIMRVSILKVMRQLHLQKNYILQVHDDHKFSLRYDENFYQTCYKIKTVLEDFNQFRLPPVVDVKYGDDLGHMESINFDAV